MLHWCSENSLRISYNLELHTACSFCSSLICRRDPKALTTCQKFHGPALPAGLLPGTSIAVAPAGASEGISAVRGGSAASGSLSGIEP